MRQGNVYALTLFLTLCLVACGVAGKQSAVEGTLVDWSGKPVAGVKITASQVSPIKGYEQFEAVTRADGTFRMGRLFPSSQYVLKPWSDKWTCDTAVRLDSAPQGETAILPSPMVIDQTFSKSDPSLVVDIATGSVAKTAVEGKLLDWNGVGVAGVKISATSGQDRTETVTVEDGVFRLSNLLASSTYVLKPYSDKWTCETSVSVATAPHHGDIDMLPSPMVVAKALSKGSGSLVIDLATGKTRFTASSEGVMTDSLSGLDWIVGPDRDTNYAQAEQWVAGCNVAGGGWRMPTLQELATLYQEGLGERNMDPAFKTTGWWVWGGPRDSSSAWDLRLQLRPRELLLPGSPTHDRVFGVRSRPRR